MSRFGRNYLEVGFYTEILFPKKQIRFVAINNSVDSDKPQDNDFTPFLNIMNEWYAKDTSNKIKSIFLSRMSDGKRCSGSIPYGYNRLPEDKQTLVVDPVASQVVKHIFELAAEGLTPPAIARQLTEEKVLIPSAYTLQYHPEQCNRKAEYGCTRWNANTVREILSRQEYLSHTFKEKIQLISFFSFYSTRFHAIRLSKYNCSVRVEDEYHTEHGQAALRRDFNFDSPVTQ